MTRWAWTDAEYEALIDRLLADNARLRGLTVDQARLYYTLPYQPPPARLSMEAAR